MNFFFDLVMDRFRWLFEERFCCFGPVSNSHNNLGQHCLKPFYKKNDEVNVEFFCLKRDFFQAYNNKKNRNGNAVATRKLCKWRRNGVDAVVAMRKRGFPGVSVDWIGFWHRGRKTKDERFVPFSFFFCDGNAQLGRRPLMKLGNGNQKKQQQIGNKTR